MTTMLPRPHTGRHVASHRPSNAAAGLLAFLAVTGYAGGAWMITHPTTWIPLRFLDGTPFDDWLLPGIALFLVNGVWPTFALVATVVRWRLAWLAQVLVGVSLLGWLAVQIPVVGFAPQFQLTYGALAAALIMLGVRARGPRRAAPTKEAHS